MKVLSPYSSFASKASYSHILDTQYLEIALASIGLDIGHNLTVRGGRGNVLTLELGQESLIGLVEGTRAAEAVDLTGTAKVAAADGVGVCVRGGEKLSINGVFNDSVDVLEDVTLSQNVATSADLEGMTAVVLPVVVDLFRVSLAVIPKPHFRQLDLQREGGCRPAPWGCDHWCGRCGCP